MNWSSAGLRAAPARGRTTIAHTVAPSGVGTDTPGSISYVALSYATKFNVPPVDVAGVTPSVANIHAKKYPFWSYEHMYTTSKSSPAAGAFIDYVRSDDGAIDSLGFIAIKDVARLASSAPSAQ